MHITADRSSGAPASLHELPLGPCSGATSPPRPLAQRSPGHAPLPLPLSLAPAPGSSARGRPSCPGHGHARTGISASTGRLGARAPAQAARANQRPAVLLARSREELARLQDHLARASLDLEAQAALEQSITELASRVGGLSALRGRLVQVLLG